MDVINALAARIDVFILVFARTLGIFLIGPVFSSRNIPVQIKIGLSAVTAYIILSVMNFPVIEGANNFWTFALMIVSETIIGVIIGFVAYLLFAGIQTAGQAIDMQMGFAIVNVVDPMFGTQIPLIGNLKYMLALMVYLVTDSHHYLFASVYKSYEYIPVNGFSYHPEVTNVVMSIFGGVLVTAIKIAFPVVGALFVVDCALGILARTVPQMNIFVVGFPLKIFVGFILLLMILPLYIVMLSSLFEGSFIDITRLLRVL